jgi:hypothetical protein
MVLACPPLTDTLTERHVTWRSFRSRKVRVCPLTQAFVEGNTNAAPEEIGARLPAPRARPAERAATVTIPTANRVDRDERSVYALHIALLLSLEPAAEARPNRREPTPSLFAEQETPPPHGRWVKPALWFFVVS